MATRYYLFQFQNGHSKYLSYEESCDYIDQYCKENNTSLSYNGVERCLNSPKKRIKDGFKAGWNPGVNEYVRGERHLNQILKEKGLELCDRRKPSEIIPEKRRPVSDKVIKDIHDSGVKLSGNEISAIKNRTYKTKETQALVSKSAKRDAS